jgi:transcription elongation factor GreB
MSRAFVKEPDGDQVINELPDRVHIPHVNYVTPAGLRQLQERLDGILSRRKIISGAVSVGNKKQPMLINRDLLIFADWFRGTATNRYRIACLCRSIGHHPN